jgi:hypothetical protein
LSSSGARDSTAFELREALGQRGCAICRLTLRSVGRFLTSLAYERVNDIELRAKLRAARGFCNPHAYRWLREAHSVLGTALIYRDIMRNALEDLGNERERSRGLLGRLRSRGADSPRGAECPACAAQREAEERYLSALAAILADPTDTPLYVASEGLCLNHALVVMRRGDVAADIVALHTRLRVERLVATLDEVIRKEDYRFRHEPRTDTERTAPADAVAWTVGADGLVNGL